MKQVRLALQSFDPNAEVSAFAAALPDAGGIASFVGQVRPAGGVEALELSHYEPLTLRGIETLADEALQRFELMGLLIVHRVGVLRPSEPIVLVCAAGRHRRGAIDAMDFVMDHIKSDAWFWKREKRAEGWDWIEPREQDHQDLRRWR